MCKDEGVPEKRSSKQITVDVSDDNDNPPVFSRSHFTAEIFENNPVPSTLITVSASDADVGDNSRISYFISNVIFNYTSPTVSQPRIPSSSFHSNFSNTFLSFSQSTKKHLSSSTSFFSNVQPPSSTLQPILPFSETPNALLNGFSINKNSGVIRVNIPFDREEISGCLIEILAKDNGKIKQHSSSVIVEMVVKDENDQKPVFDRLEYTFSTLESTQPGSIIGSVLAIDSDAFPYNIFFYRIKKYSSPLEKVHHKHTKMQYHQRLNQLSNSPSSFSSLDHLIINTENNMFNIDSTTGDIILNFSLDKEKSDVYIFSVEAVENNEDSVLHKAYIASATVVVKIDDVNDHNPSFVYPPPGLTFKVYVGIDEDFSENKNKTNSKNLEKKTKENNIKAQKTGTDKKDSSKDGVTTVGWVMAVDRDSNIENSQVFYTIIACQAFSAGNSKITVGNKAYNKENADDGRNNGNKNGNKGNNDKINMEKNSMNKNNDEKDYNMYINNDNPSLEFPLIARTTKNDSVHKSAYMSFEARLLGESLFILLLLVLLE